MEGSMQIGSPTTVSGDELKQYVIDAIKSEGIEIKETFESSMKQRSTYQISHQWNEKPKHVIYMPRFTDWSDTEIALLLAYHLGQFHLKRQRDQLEKQGIIGFMKVGIQSEKPAYIHHKQAWTWAEAFFKDKGLLVRWQDLWAMKSLTKSPSLVTQVIKGTRKFVVHWVVRPLLLAYGIVAAFLMLELNGIPPFGAANLDGVDNESVVFFVYVIYLFLCAFKFVAISLKEESNEKE